MPPLEDSLSLRTNCVTLGAGLPPVPSKLVARIEAGEFIDMGELLPDRVGVSRPDDTGKALTKRRTVSGILEWIKCFNVYLAVISRKQPERIPDLLAYETLIIEAHMEYSGDAWLGYDRRFRQCAATDVTKNWAIIDPTLWNLAFSGKARVTRCKFCFSLSHASSDCAWATDQPISQPNRVSTSSGTSSRSTRICYAWNSHPQAGCPYPSCMYEHICTFCSKNPSIIDKRHKAIFCPHYHCGNSIAPRPLFGSPQQSQLH